MRICQSMPHLESVHPHRRLERDHPLWTNRVGIVDWTELDAEVARDIEIAREAALADSSRPVNSR
jgi:hypothetical protein